MYEVSGALFVAIDDRRRNVPPLDGRLLAPVRATVRTVFSNNKRVCIDRPAGIGACFCNWLTGGIVIWLTGAKVGDSASIGGLHESDHFDASPTAGGVVEHLLGLKPFRKVMAATDDGLHPDDASSGWGGTNRMVDVYAAKYAELAA